MAVLNSAKIKEAIKEDGHYIWAKSFYRQVPEEGAKTRVFRYSRPITKTRREIGFGSFDI